MSQKPSADRAALSQLYLLQPARGKEAGEVMQGPGQRTPHPPAPGGLGLAQAQGWGQRKGKGHCTTEEGETVFVAMT